MRSTIAQMNEEFSFNGKLDERLRIGFNLEFLSEALKSMEGDEVSAWVVGQSDGSGDIPWAVKMEIKNDLFGEKRVAVEVFPTQDRLVDVCDCYHLWVFEKGFQLPFGIHPRDKKTVTVNRGSTRVRAIDGAGREHSIKELLEENGAADVPKQAYAQAMAGYMMKNLLGG